MQPKTMRQEEGGKRERSPRSAPKRNIIVQDSKDIHYHEEKDGRNMIMTKVRLAEASDARYSMSMSITHYEHRDIGSESTRRGGRIEKAQKFRPLR